METVNMANGDHMTNIKDNIVKWYEKIKILCIQLFYFCYALFIYYVF